MTNYILQFSQSFALYYKLDITDLHILNYMLKLFSSGYAKYYRETQQTRVNDFYYLISYNKIIEDMPILNLHQRAIQKRFKKYKELGLMESKVISKQIYIKFVKVEKWLTDFNQNEQEK